jgi:hypothetical protein
MPNQTHRAGTSEKTLRGTGVSSCVQEPTWTKPYHGIEHMDLARRTNLRQVTLTARGPSVVDVFALGPHGFTDLWRERHTTVEKAKKAAAKYARLMGAL